MSASTSHPIQSHTTSTRIRWRNILFGTQRIAQNLAHVGIPVPCNQEISIFGHAFYRLTFTIARSFELEQLMSLIREEQGDHWFGSDISAGVTPSTLDNYIKHKVTEFFKQAAQTACPPVLVTPSKATQPAQESVGETHYSGPDESHRTGLLQLQNQNPMWRMMS
eukprot:CAMPEP_0178771988 /NCGR_PEP_ID=MMETSP0744-20121128/22285_1 /TAXON_ID=913974 /ORGANISM="Nitzschia punctata, Strain CCMP561" /LENGTH=164 /DNA_ID=CAMNT_0020428601 /DNA_START=27 /DNA_END=518 /DNA_ORIENTATION=+